MTWREEKRTPAGRAARVQRATWAARRKRGWTRASFTEAYTRQGGRCAICNLAFGTAMRDSPRADHDHTTGRPRGLICHRCNAGIGMLGDNLAGLEQAVAYLRQFEDGVPSLT